MFSVISADAFTVKARPIPPIVRSARRCLQMLRSEMDMINIIYAI